MGNVYKMPKPVSAIEPEPDSPKPTLSAVPYYLHGADVPKTPAQRLDEKLVQARLNHISKTEREELEHLRYVVADKFRAICKDYFYLSVDEALSLSLGECKLLVQRIAKISKDKSTMLEIYLANLFGGTTILVLSFAWVNNVYWGITAIRVFAALMAILAIWRIIQLGLPDLEIRSFLRNLKKLRKFYGEDYFPYDDFRSRLKDKE